MMPATFNRPMFATDRVRFVGDIVAAVVAETPRPGGRRRRAGRSSTYDPLPAVVAGRRRAAPRRAAAVPRARARTSASPPSFGEDGDPLEGADVVAEVTMVSQRLAGVPMETNGCLVVPATRPTAGSRCGSRTRRRTRSHGAGAAPSGSSPRSSASSARGSAAGSARRPPATSSTSWRRRPPLGAGPPVKWAETRSEDMVSLVHGRDYVMTAKLGADARTARSSASTPTSSPPPVRTRPSARSCRCSPR